MQDLIFDRVEKQFNAGTYALKNINIRFPAGSFTTLLGPSGCGKSTALNCVAGLIQPSGGEIRIGDKRLDTQPPERRNVGMVFQSYALFPHMTAADNVAFGLKIRKVSKDDIKKKVDHALSLMRLSAMHDRRPSEMSGGQQQRLAFARMMVLEPQILLLDEPLSNLDAKLREEMQIEIKNLHDRLKITTVFVTHDQTEAFALSDQIVAMNHGVVEQIGHPEIIYNKPVSEFVARFVGFNNSLPVTVTSKLDDRVTVSVAGQSVVVKTETPLENGQRARLCFRPQAAELGSEGLDAVVQTVQFSGGAYSIRAQAGEAALQIQSAKKPQVGSKLKVKINPDHALLFADLQ